MEEILHQLIFSLSYDFHGLKHPKGGFLAGFLNHQQYGDEPPWAIIPNLL